MVEEDIRARVSEPCVCGRIWIFGWCIYVLGGVKIAARGNMRCYQSRHRPSRHVLECLKASKKKRRLFNDGRRRSIVLRDGVVKMAKMES